MGKSKAKKKRLVTSNVDEDQAQSRVPKKDASTSGAFRKRPQPPAQRAPVPGRIVDEVDEDEEVEEPDVQEIQHPSIDSRRANTSSVSDASFASFLQSESSNGLDKGL